MKLCNNLISESSVDQVKKVDIVQMKNKMSGK